MYLNEEDDSFENKKFWNANKEKFIKDKILGNFNNNNNKVKLVDFKEDKKKGFQFIKKKEFYNFTNNNNLNNNLIGFNFVDDKNINNGNINFNNNK